MITQTYHHRTHGFSLVEILVSLIVLSLALLGTATLSGVSLKSTNTSHYRSQATILADDILDRMRANITEARNQQYDISIGPTYAAGAGTMAYFDCTEWIANIVATLPEGKGVVDVDGNIATVTISWGEVGVEPSFVTASQL